MGKVMYMRKGSTHIAPYKKFIITFIMNDGTSDSMVFETNHEGKVQDFPEVLRDGYSFNGWFTAASGGSQVTSNTVFTEDTAIYAQWTLLTIPVTITGSGNTSYCYATIGGTKRYSAGTYEVLPGDTITFGVYGYSSSYYGRVTINGTQALNVTDKTTQTYNWTVPSGMTSITIEMSYNSASWQRNGRIGVTTEG